MQKNIEIVLSPLLLPLVDLKGKTVVVIDILRATSTICAALDNGALSVTPVVSVEEALQYDKSDYLVAGERNGQKAEGFDFGNSPAEYAPSLVKGKKIVLTTTNGTKCIHASLDASEILVGSFYNLARLSEYLSDRDNGVVLFCSGWKNRVNLEDTLFAGYLAQSLSETHIWDSDEVELALSLVNKAQFDPVEYLRNASHAKRFARLGNHTDLPLCMQFDKHPVLVKYKGGKLVSSY
ncbi:MAG: 2-phosphosulfolactate phosphatase [Bacteroidia bacterium]|nr:2-phosphosulfolactate phosphatase [Bacteroidia bacterium]